MNHQTSGQDRMIDDEIEIVNLFNRTLVNIRKRLGIFTEKTRRCFEQIKPSPNKYFAYLSKIYERVMHNQNHFPTQ